MDSSFQCGPRRRMLVRGEAFVVTEATQHSFVRSHLVRIFAANHFAQCVRQNAVSVSYGGDNSRNQFVLSLEDDVTAEGTLISFGPQMRSGTRVDHFDGDTKVRARLAEIAFDHIACA